MDFPILSVAIRYEQDVVLVRRRARQIATLIGFEEQDGTRIATAASEIGRNAFSYANGGKAEFLVEGGSGKQVLVVRISDEGPGIRNTEEILSGQYQSQTGMGLGIVGARRLMDGFELKSSPGRGTVVTLKKNFPPAAPQFNVASLAGLTDHLTQAPQDFLEEVRLHNHELLEALDSLQERQEELSRLNKELEETNRGVVALYAELDEKAEHLRRADQLKSRFLSHMSHEFRTPLNAIIGLTRLLIKRDDIAKSPDASRQITYIQKSAQELTELVNDLLDLAKVEAGKLTIHTVEFDASELLRGLRGILRPLLTHDNIDLTFDEVSLPTMKSDEGKIAQILRNFVSNALKFTEQGEVRVSAVYESELDSVVFSVRDTGIGIAPEHLGRIFEEFSQIDSPTQQRVKGTGLGLPLCKKLAELLGGSIRVESKVGQGSTFSAVIPRVLGVFAPQMKLPVGPPRHKVLLIDDEEVSRYLLRQLLPESCSVIEANTGARGIESARSNSPEIIFLDLNMPEMTGFEVLRQLKGDPATRFIPIVIVTSQRLTEQDRQLLIPQTVAIISKETLARAESIRVDFGPVFGVSVEGEAQGPFRMAESLQ